jgi:hypothetical protein
MAHWWLDVENKIGTDAKFREAILKDPKAALAAEGIQVDDTVKVQVIEATSTLIPLVVPAATEELSDDALAGVAGGKGGGISFPGGGIYVNT